MSDSFGLDMAHFNRFLALPEVLTELDSQRERIISDMREACRMGHVDELEPEPASVSARRAERAQWLADISPLVSELADA